MVVHVDPAADVATVAVHPDVDAGALHVRFADEAVPYLKAKGVGKGLRWE